MKLKLKHVSFGLVVLLLSLSLGYHWLAPASLHRAPEVNFNIVDGRTLSLGQLSARPVLVVFWATTCESCIREIPHLIDLYHDFSSRGLEIIAVAMAYDPPNQVMEMRQRKQIPYPIALDIQGDIARAFADVRLTPTTFLIDPQGQVVIQKTGMLDMKEMRSKLQSMLPASTGG